MLLEILKPEAEAKLDFASSFHKEDSCPNQLFHESIQFPNLSLKRTDLPAVPSHLLVQFLWNPQLEKHQNPRIDERGQNFCLERFYRKERGQAKPSLSAFYAPAPKSFGKHIPI